MRKTKVKTVGERRREKKAARERFSELAAQFGAEPPRRMANGRVSRAQDEKPQKQAIRKRCEQMGWLPRKLDDGSLSYTPTAAMAKLALAPHMGCPAGIFLEKSDLPQAEFSKLWQAVIRICSVDVAYRAINGLPRRFPKAVDLLVAPSREATGVTIERRYDPRSEQEKARGITDEWMGLKQTLGMAGKGVLLEVEGVVLMDHAVKDGAKLLRGLSAVAASS